MNETRFANIIIDISHESVDRTFQYRVPERLFGQLSVGQQVAIPFGAGDKLRKGYIVELTNRAEFDESRMKEIADVVTGSVPAQAQLIALAWWMNKVWEAVQRFVFRRVATTRGPSFPIGCQFCELCGLPIATSACRLSELCR